MMPIPGNSRDFSDRLTHLTIALDAIIHSLGSILEDHVPQSSVSDKLVRQVLAEAKGLCESAKQLRCLEKVPPTYPPTGRSLREATLVEPPVLLPYTLGHIVRAVVVTLEHEINNPLMVILGYLELLSSALEDQGQEHMVAMIARARNQIERIQHIIHRLGFLEVIHLVPYLKDIEMLDLSAATPHS